MHWLVLEHGSANFISTAAVAQYLKRELEVCCCLTHPTSRNRTLLSASSVFLTAGVLIVLIVIR